MDIHDKYKEIRKLYNSYTVIKNEANKFPEDKTMQKLLKEASSKIEKIGADIKSSIAKFEKNPQTKEFKEAIKKIKELAKANLKGIEVKEFKSEHKIEEYPKDAAIGISNLEIIQVINKKNSFTFNLHLYSDARSYRKDNLYYFNHVSPKSLPIDDIDNIDAVIEGSINRLEDFYNRIEKNLQDAGFRRGFDLKVDTSEIEIRKEIKEVLENLRLTDISESDDDVRTGPNGASRSFRSYSDSEYYRSGKEDDDHPDFIGGNKIKEQVNRQLPAKIKDKVVVDVMNQEKSWFTVSIKIKKG